MAYQNISHSMSEEDINAVKNAIATIEGTMPFLVNLNTNEIRTMVKLGSRSVDFVQDAAQAVSNFGDILPPSFDKEEYIRDTALFKNLTEIKMLVDSLSEKVNNTYTAVGSEAMSSSLEVYAYVQTAATRVPGLASVAAKLKERFKRQSGKHT